MIWDQLNTTLDVYRRSGAPDGSGGLVDVWALAGQVRARVSQPRAVERVLAEQAGSRHDHNVYLGPGEDVRRGDRLRPAGAAADSTPYYAVVSVVAPSEPVYLRAECELVQAEGG
ncbi:MAG TPA: head-tail adaptor protein [Micromonosporaceae bacterium]|nr:head-tail adaptor protein [Micromonosporaceae bacterium]